MDYLSKDVSMVNSLGRQKQCLPPEKGLTILLSIIKDSCYRFRSVSSTKWNLPWPSRGLEGLKSQKTDPNNDNLTSAIAVSKLPFVSGPGVSSTHIHETGAG